MKRRLFILVIVSLAILGGVVSAMVWDNDHNNSGPNQQSFSDTSLGVSVKFSAKLNRKSPLELNNNSIKELLRLTEPAGETPLLLTLRYETGIKEASTVLKKSPLETMLINSERTLPAQYNGFSKISTTYRKISNKEAAEIVFSYQHQGQNLQQRLLLVAKDDNTAIYLTAQTKQAEYKRVNSLYFDSIYSSLVFI